MRFLVTAGPTREHLDPVRFLSNPSTGKMGFAIAEAARKISPDVTLISGPTHLQPPRNVRFTPVVSAMEMFAAVKHVARRVDIVIMSAAVGDWRPLRVSKRKQKKKSGPQTITLVRTPDILASLGKRKRRGQVLVGFAAETHGLLKYARGKLERKNLDLIVANDVSARDAGFASDTNRVILLWRGGKIERLPKANKARVARWILQRVVRYAKVAAQ
jgi:phosphopantothenoylcysteine decarboxylase/phosphopantothenate--cysteine ligase